MKKQALYIVFLISVLGCFSAVAQENDTQEKEGPRDEFFEKIHESKRKPLDLPYVREADVAWKKTIWRAVDLTQRFNQYLYFPLDSEEDAQGRINLVNAIWKATKEGKITLYSDDEFKIPLSFSELEARFNKIDTLYQDDYDDDDNYVGQKQVISQQDFSSISKDFQRLNIKEQWYIDKQYTGQFVRIIGICLVRDDYRTDPETQEKIYRGIQPLGWVRMADESVRELMATTGVFVGQNEAENRSLEQIFLKRYFDSFITRESNIQNRSIDQYRTGVDALIEADRVKAELLNMELDMWEY